MEVKHIATACFSRWWSELWLKHEDCAQVVQKCKFLIYGTKFASSKTTRGEILMHTLKDCAQQLNLVLNLWL